MNELYIMDMFGYYITLRAVMDNILVYGSNYEKWDSWILWSDYND